MLQFYLFRRMGKQKKSNSHYCKMSLRPSQTCTVKCIFNVTYWINGTNLKKLCTTSMFTFNKSSCTSHFLQHAVLHWASLALPKVMLLSPNMSSSFVMVIGGLPLDWLCTLHHHHHGLVSTWILSLLNIVGNHFNVQETFSSEFFLWLFHSILLVRQAWGVNGVWIIEKAGCEVSREHHV